VRCFEHAYQLDTTTARELADAGAYLTPTLVVTHAFDWMAGAGFDEASIDRSRRMASVHEDSAAAAVEAGVSILHGTDFTPVGRSDGTILAVLELELLVRAGLTPLDALRSASRTPAELMKLSSESWRLMPGAAADIVSVDADPLRSVSAMRSLRPVVVGGQFTPATA
jgi:imidazolonepropionase-like amidohydrolase